MDLGLRPRSTRDAGRRTWMLAALGTAALVVSGLSPVAATAETTVAPAAETTLTPAAETPAAPIAETPVTPAAETPVTPAAEVPVTPAAGTSLTPAAATPAAPAAETTWLCKPGLVSDPCLSSEETTVELGNGASFLQPSQPASNPPIDCFYVYPTVSSQLTTNATLKIDPEETQIAIDQASRFSQTCNVYAPIYPQLTLVAITTPGRVTPEASLQAYLGVLSAWKEYLAKYNDGRGIVLIGHSQGAFLLKQLIKEQIDPNPALRKQLVSAVLLGGNVLVPKGKKVGGEFQNVPACQVAWETHCVVAYSSFLKEPPEGADFGRVNSPLVEKTLTEEEADKLEVLCVNPSLLLQGDYAGPLLRYESTTPFPGFLGLLGDIRAPKAPTPWVSMPWQYTAQCEHANGSSWLQLTNVGPAGETREQVTEVLGPLWGTHLEDVNVALGNLVQLTTLESLTYQLENRRPPPRPPKGRRFAPPIHHQQPVRRIERRPTPRGRHG